MDFRTAMSDSVFENWVAWKRGWATYKKDVQIQQERRQYIIAGGFRNEGLISIPTDLSLVGVYSRTMLLSQLAKSDDNVKAFLEKKCKDISQYDYFPKKLMRLFEKIEKGPLKTQEEKELARIAKQVTKLAKEKSDIEAEVKGNLDPLTQYIPKALLAMSQQLLSVTVPEAHGPRIPARLAKLQQLTQALMRAEEPDKALQALGIDQETVSEDAFGKFLPKELKGFRCQVHMATFLLNKQRALQADQLEPLEQALKTKTEALKPQRIQRLQAEIVSLERQRKAIQDLCDVEGFNKLDLSQIKVEIMGYDINGVQARLEKAVTLVNSRQKSELASIKAIIEALKQAKWALGTPLKSIQGQKNFLENYGPVMKALQTLHDNLEDNSYIEQRLTTVREELRLPG